MGLYVYEGRRAVPTTCSVRAIRWIVFKRAGCSDGTLLAVNWQLVANQAVTQDENAYQILLVYWYGTYISICNASSLLACVYFYCYCIIALSS